MSIGSRHGSLDLRRTIIIGTLVCAVLAGLALWGPWSSPNGDPTPIDRETDTQCLPGETPAEIGGPHPEVARSQVKVPAIVPPSVPAAVMEGERSPSSRSTRSLRVEVISDTGEPVEGAIVCFVRETGMRPEFFSRTRAQLQEEAMGRGGEGLSDAEGKVTLTVPPSANNLYGWKGEAFGVAIVPSDLIESGLPFVLTLHPAKEMEIHLRDAEGGPASGVDLALLRRQTNHRHRDEYHPPLDLGTTDSNGVLRLYHLNALRHQLHSVPSHSGAEVPMLLARIPGLEDELKPLDLAAPNTSPLLWQLPPTGSVEILLQDGRQVSVEFAKLLRLSSTDIWPRGSYLATGAKQRVPWVLSRVGLGIRAVCILHLDGQSYQKIFDGPKAPDEKVTVVLEPTKRKPAVTGRLRVPDEAVPEGDQEQQYRVVLTGQSTRDRGPSVTHHGDGKLSDGFFVFRIEAGTREAGPTLNEARITLHHRGGEVAVAWLGTLTMPDVDDLHLGDLHGMLSPILASGIALLDGRPTRGVQVRLLVEGGTERRVVASSHSGQDGRFTVRGTHLSDRFWIEAQHGRAASMEQVEIQRGTSDLQLDLVGATDRQILMVLAEAAIHSPHAGLPFLRLVKNGSSDNNKPIEIRSQQSLTQIPGGSLLRFQTKGITHGLYSTHVHLPGIPDAVHRSVLDLRKTAEDDQGIVQIDLRDVLLIVTIRFEDANGAPLPGNPVLVSVGTPPAQSDVTVRASSVSLLLPGAGADVQVSDTHKIQVVPLPALRADTVVRLHRTSRKVEIHFAKGKDLPTNIITQLVVEDEQGEYRTRANLHREGKFDLFVPSGVRIRMAAHLMSGPKYIRLPSTDQWVELDQEQVTITVDAKEWAAELAGSLPR